MTREKRERETMEGTEMTVKKTFLDNLEFL